MIAAGLGISAMPKLVLRLLPFARLLSLAGNEDCLYLNLFTPAADGVRPVIVWI